jgi:uncharacterized protein
MHRGIVSRHFTEGYRQSVKPRDDKRPVNRISLLDSPFGAFQNNSMSWITVTKDGVILNIHATPRASKSQVQGLYGDALKVRLQAPPVDGKANEALLEFLSDTLGVPQRRLTLVSGQTGRQKRVAVPGRTPHEVAKVFGVENR